MGQGDRWRVGPKAAQRSLGLAEVKERAGDRAVVARKWGVLATGPGLGGPGCPVGLETQTGSSRVYPDLEALAFLIVLKKAF